MFNKLQESVRYVGVGTLTVVVVLAAFVATPAHAVPELMTAYGDQMAWTSAEANAMGNTGTAVYRGGLSNIFNPAFLTAETGQRFEVNFLLDQEHEDRFQPLFDNFDSWVADAAIASNRNHFWQSSFAFAFNAGTADQPVAIGLSMADRYSFDYKFEEELRNPNGRSIDNRDLVMEQRSFDVTGKLRNLSLGFGSEVYDGISVGGAIHYAYGNRDESKSLRDYFADDGDGSFYSVNDQDFEGVNYTIGVRGVINERLEVGAAWESALLVKGDGLYNMTTLTDTISIMGDRSIRYPNIYRVGFTFRPQTDPRTVFTIEVEYKPWSELEDSEIPAGGNPQNLNDVTDVRVGLEHTFYNGSPLRFGFRHYDSYMDRDASISVFSTGIGAPIAGGMITANIELSKSTSVMTHHFPYPTDFFGDQFTSADDARVEDTRFRVGVGYKVEF